MTLNLGWLIAVPLLGVAAVVWWRPGLPIGCGDAVKRSYLSAVGQSLASILALVFSMSLVIVQLSSNYSQRVIGNFFDAWTIVYILLFIGTVFVSFWFLGKPTADKVKVSLSLGAACLLILVPYFLSFRDRLDPVRIVNDLEEDARQVVDQDSRSKEAAALDNVAMRAYGLNDYDTFREAADALLRLADRAYRGDNTEAGADIVERLKLVGLLTIEDPRAPFHLVAELGPIAGSHRRSGDDALALDRTVTRSAPYVVGQALGEIGIAAARRSREDAADLAAAWLGDIGTTITTEGIETTTMIIAGALGEIGVAAADSGLRSSTKQAAAKLGLLAEAASKEKLDAAAEEAVRWLGRIGISAANEDMDAAADLAAARLGIAGEEALKNGMDDVFVPAIQTLGDLGVVAASRRLGATTAQAAARLRDLGTTAIAESPVEGATAPGDQTAVGQGEVALLIVGRLGEVALEAARGAMTDTAEDAADYLRELDGGATVWNLDTVVIAAAAALWELGTWGTFNDNDRIRDKAAHALESVESAAANQDMRDKAKKDAKRRIDDEGSEGLREAFSEFATFHDDQVKS